MSKGTRYDSNIAFVGTQKMQTEESFSCLCNSLMPMLRHHCPHHQPSSCFGEGGEEISSLGAIYDAATASTAAAVAATASAAGSVMTSKSLHHHFSSTEPSFTFNPLEAVNVRVPFTAAQWQELERQTAIFKYIMDSVPVPPKLLIPITKSPTNTIKGSVELGFPSNNSTDPEPWRCRRTDGKKWRCSRDVVPNQKYCERHSHKSRSRSRKPVESPAHFLNNNDVKSLTLNISASNTTKPHQNPHLLLSSTPHFDPPRCSERFSKGDSNVPFAWNSNQVRQGMKTQSRRYGENESDFQLNLQSAGGPINLNLTHSEETRGFIDAWSIADGGGSGSGTNGIASTKCFVSSNLKLPPSSLTLSMSGGDAIRNDNNENGQMDGFENMGLRPQWMSSPSPPGGPLAEALCLGIASSQSANTRSCNKSMYGDDV
ncbi:hypothetical protein SLEP1_g16244 [Rubroshorea leprosula]|uniref:Growth-regulating factor n=1 Tax=Rubroshorea leprosula TaxID=152421 RepID=A0AAV5IQ98_9ROSI|nr:hypothetical protein SLEP1_g16244 [Rubroshorea leprosula]